MRFCLKVQATTDPKLVSVEGDFKSWLKRVAVTLAGLVLFAKTAFGMELKNPERLARKATAISQQLAKESRSNSVYEVKVEVKYKRIGSSDVKAQEVVYKVLKDGKIMGKVLFTGVDSDKVQKSTDLINFEDFLHGEVTKDSDEIVKIVTSALRNVIADKL